MTKHIFGLHNTKSHYKLLELLALHIKHGSDKAGTKTELNGTDYLVVHTRTHTISLIT